MNASIDIQLVPGSDAETANIEIRSFGCVSELRFADDQLNAVAQLQTSEIGRILQVLKAAEEQRTSPNDKTIAAIEHLRERYSLFTEEDPTRMTLSIDLVLPIASGGSVYLQPNMGIDTFE